MDIYLFKQRCTEINIHCWGAMNIYLCKYRLMQINIHFWRAMDIFIFKYPLLVSNGYLSFFACQKKECKLSKVIYLNINCTSAMNIERLLLQKINIHFDVWWIFKWITFAAHHASCECYSFKKFVRAMVHQRKNIS